MVQTGHHLYSKEDRSTHHKAGYNMESRVEKESHETYGVEKGTRR